MISRHTPLQHEDALEVSFWDLLDVSITPCHFPGLLTYHRRCRKVTLQLHLSKKKKKERKKTDGPR